MHHRFGSYSSSNEEAQSIRAKAKAGETFYVRLWWIIFDNLYRQDLYGLSEADVKRFEDEAFLWRIKAINSHFPIALQIQTEALTLDDHASEEFKLEAIRVAQKLVDAGVYGAEKLLVKAENLTTEQHIRNHYFEQLNNLNSLNLKEAENLLWAAEQGEFYYDINYYSKSGPVKNYYQDFITVPKQTDKVEEILMSLSGNLEHAKSSYRLYKTYEGEDFEKALTFLREASRQGDHTATAELGVYLYCSEDKFQGQILIKKAAEHGHEPSIGHRKEIALTNTLSVCN